MSLVVIGTVAFDAIETPFGKTDKIVGGAATYASLAASYFFDKVKIVAVVGDDFPQSEIDDCVRALPLSVIDDIKFAQRQIRNFALAQRAALHEIPIVPVEASDSEALELAIIENVQRSDLNPLEEAGGYQALASDYGHSHEEIARIVGKSRSHVTNTLRLLKLPEPVKAYIHAGKITAGAARMLIGAPDPEEMAREIVDRGLNVRQVEALAKDRASGKGRAAKTRAMKSADTIALERRVSDALGLAVVIDHRGEAGVLRIHYSNLDQLDGVLRRLERN